MGEHKGIILLAGGLAVLLIGAMALYRVLPDYQQRQEGERLDQSQVVQDMEQEEAENQPVPAPGFTVQTAQGEEVDLETFAGSPIVLNFWASWCPPCKGEMPYFQSAYERYGEDVQFIMVNLTDGKRETVEKAKKYLQEFEYTFPVFYDVEQEAAITYGVYAIPATIFIDADGFVAGAYPGALSEEALLAGIEFILPGANS